MNRIYPGKVTAVEIPQLGYRLSHIGHSPQAQPLDHSGFGCRSLVIGDSAQPPHHELFQDAVTPLLRIGWGEGGGSRMR